MSPRNEKQPMSTTDQVTAMCQQMSLELAFLTNSTDNDDFSEKFYKSNDPGNIGEPIMLYKSPAYPPIWSKASIKSTIRALATVKTINLNTSRCKSCACFSIYKMDTKVKPIGSTIKRKRSALYQIRTLHFGWYIQMIT